MMIEVVEDINTVLGKTLEKSKFKSIGGWYLHTSKDIAKGTSLKVFTGFVAVSYDFNNFEYAEIGITYNGNIGFKPYIDNIFANYFNKYFCFKEQAYEMSFGSLGHYKSDRNFDEVRAAMLYKAKYDSSKNQAGNRPRSAFVNALILASKEMKNFMYNHIKDGGQFYSNNYTPKFLVGKPPSSKSVPRGRAIAYSKKLRR